MGKMISFLGAVTLLGYRQQFTVLRAWHWFDRVKAIAEAKRLLKESGCLIVMDSGFHPKKPHPLYLKTLEIAQKYRNGAVKPAGSKAEATSRLLGFPRNWFDEWEAAGFEWTAGWQWEYVVPFSHEYWCGRIRTFHGTAGFRMRSGMYLTGKCDRCWKKHFQMNRLKCLTYVQF
ncbi:hypothetical protein JIR001_25890 [Polycladomyces abyssicola]|uniref:Methyltransferase n=1 Tax=Polycladomyces abyssicola TaxID=1125966 RepID=A0A8D5UHZ9_9BACL|nr:hypothetical protein [Polycladomyces abyssicola]BCU82806.1 hypothetical protein JIR001_25890 [Polycladomyces abyssicola]